LFLDENIKKKKNKYMINQLFQENTPFLDCDEFKIKPGSEVIFSINFAHEKESNRKNNVEEIDKNFPLLDEKKMDILFKNNFLIKDQHKNNLYIDFYTPCLRILKDKKYTEGYSNIGYNINFTKDLKTNNEPYVLKLWILLVCYSFKRIDDEEKWIIFYEFLWEIQNNISNSLIDPFLVDLIFSTFIKYGDKQMCSLLYKELNECVNVKEDYITFMKLHKKFLRNKYEYEKIFPKNAFLKERNYNIFNLPSNKRMEIVLISQNPGCPMVNLKPTILNFSGQDEGILTYKCPICQKYKEALVTVSLGKGKKEDLTYKLYSAKYLFYYVKNLGDYNMQTFYKEHTEIFFNLFILFQLRVNFYEFIFPYKGRKDFIGFDPNKLYVKSNKKIKYVKKDKNKDNPKWYDVIEDVRGRQKRLTQIIPSKINNLENFKHSETLSSEMFFKKYNKKIVRNTLRLSKKPKIEG